MTGVLVKNADRMMTKAIPSEKVLEVIFADGRSGIIPFSEIAEMKDIYDLAELDLPNPYEIIIQTKWGKTVEIPWDFARHYCDAAFHAREEAAAVAGREAMGARIRRLREARGMTQEKLSDSADIGRVTLVRIEKGEQSPRLETLMALARALDVPLEELLVEGAV